MSSLSSEWYIEEPLTKTSNFNAASQAYNNGRLALDGSRYLDLTFRPCLDVINSIGVLPFGVSMKLRFHKASSRFCLMSSADMQDYYLQIQDINVEARFVNPVPELRSSLTRQMEKQLYFPIVRNEVMERSLSSGVTTIYESAILKGALPKQFCVYLLSDAQRAGAYDQNPFSIVPRGLTTIQAYINGQAYPGESGLHVSDNYLEMARAFQYFLSNANVPDDENIGLTVQSYTEGNAIFCFDLTPLMNNSSVFQQELEGEISLKLSFKDPVGAGLKMMVHAVYDNAIIISQNAREIETVGYNS